MAEQTMVCPQCGYAMGAFDKECPRCRGSAPATAPPGTTVRHTIARPVSQPSTSVERDRRGLGKVVGVWVAFFIACFLFSAARRALNHQPAVQQPSGATSANYTMLKEWHLGEDGIGQIILIKPERNNLAAMKALGAELTQRHLGKRVIMIDIFDDTTAVAMRDRVSRLSPSEEVYYDRHHIGFLARNHRDGYNALTWIKGGKVNNTEVFKYPS